jgi:HJR/Mrr/RecB family endonuclease
MIDKLQEAIAAIKSGDKMTGSRLLAEIITANPRGDNAETAWLWMAAALDDLERKRQCLEHVLALNPNNSIAKKKIEELKSSELSLSSEPPLGASSSPSGDIDNLSGLDFEMLVMRLLKKMGLQVKETKKTGDGGIDIIAHSPEPITGGLYVVQCKRYSSNVGEPVVRDLYGVVNHVNASKGVLITNSNFTRQAKEFAEGKPIELVNGNALKELLAKHSLNDSIPEGKRLYVYPASFKRLYKGLSRIMDRLGTILAVDSASVNRGTKDYPLMEFLNLATAKPDDVMRVENIVRLVNDAGMKGSDHLTDSEVDYRLKVVDEIINDLLKRRKTILDARVEDRFIQLKQAALELFDAPLIQLADFMKGMDRRMEELDGTLVESDFKIDSVLTLNVDSQASKLTQEINKINQELESIYQEQRMAGRQGGLLNRLLGNRPKDRG